MTGRRNRVHEGPPVAHRAPGAGRARRRIAVLVALAAGVTACGPPASDAGAPTVAAVGEPVVTTPDADALIAEPGERGDFLASCPFSHRSSDDPLVHPGHPGQAHSHDFFGNTATDAGSTTASLVAGDTTCTPRSDRSGYWAPTLYADGEPVTPEVADVYYVGVVGSDVTRAVPPPEGLGMLAGDPVGQHFDARHTGWGCGNTKRIEAVPYDCEVPAKLALHVNFPDCWDGQHLDSEDHTSHVAYSTDGACPSTHPVPMVQVQVVIRYPISETPDAMWFASGDLATAHADFMNGWDQTALAREVQTCVNRRVTCAVY